MPYDYYPEYVSIARQKAKAHETIEKLRKIDPTLAPVVIKGSEIATTWWGKAWNKNLTSYADYKSRVTRGSSYVRRDAVIDLFIDEGVIRALVLGTKATPYTVMIHVKPLADEIWKPIFDHCHHKIENLEGLLSGRFPKVIVDIFTAKGAGLFPSPDEISFSCTCPDRALMCKHVAATLFGVGARLDEDPRLFFKLRAIAFDLLIHKSIEEKMASMLKHAGKKSDRMMPDEAISKLFDL